MTKPMTAARDIPVCVCGHVKEFHRPDEGYVCYNSTCSCQEYRAVESPMQSTCDTLQFIREQLTLCKQAVGNPSVNEYHPYLTKLHVNGALEHITIGLEVLAIYGYTPDPVAAPEMETVDELSSLMAEREAERETLPRRVRVVKAGGPKFWYANSIGKVFEVTGNVRSIFAPGYWVINPDDPSRIEHYVIDIEDCEIVTEPTPDPLSDRERELLRQARIAYDFFKTQYPHLVILAELERAIEAYGERVRELKVRD